MTPSGEGFAVFESGLAIADLFAHHLQVHMRVILLVRKAPLRMSCQGLEFLKEMQGEGGEEDMVVLFFAPSAFDVFAGEEPGLLVQIDISPFGLVPAEQGTQFQTDLAAISNAAAGQARAVQKKRLALEQNLTTSDQQHTKELSDAQRNQALLRDRVATTEPRLSVLLDATDTASGCDVPAAPSTVGVVHALRRAPVDPVHAKRILTITDEGGQGLIALQTCQAYAKAVSAPE